MVSDSLSTIHNLSTPPVGYADSPLKEGADNASLPEGGGTLVPEGVNVTKL